MEESRRYEPKPLFGGSAEKIVEEKTVKGPSQGPA